MKFSISVGGLYLRDHITVNSIMPVLVAPQIRVGCAACSSEMMSHVAVAMHICICISVHFVSMFVSLFVTASIFVTISFP